MRSVLLVLAIVAPLALSVAAPVASADDGCTFAQGTTTCVATTRRTETTERIVVSGCLSGPTGVPGRRTTTFRDTFLVTETTTTRAHGRQGPIYDSRSAVTRMLVTSIQISSVCEPL